MYTILIVDDTETNIDILLELLSDEYDVLVALDAKGALTIVQEEKVDLILLDIMMPEMDGYEVCKILKNQTDTKNIPIIFITAKVDEDSIEKAYDIGGDDYVTKPFRPRELLARVKIQLKIKHLMADLNYIASYDAMTGIYNRREFFKLATQKFNNSKKDIFAVMIDIDNFKKINDTYGHSTGDKVIKIITKTISENIFNDAIFGRIGGEEFAIICNQGPSNVIEKIENIRYLIEKLEVIADNGDIIKFTISNGVSKVNENIHSLDSLLKEADKALYEAKGSGRNKVIFR